MNSQESYLQGGTNSMNQSYSKNNQSSVKNYSYYFSKMPEYQKHSELIDSISVIMNLVSQEKDYSFKVQAEKSINEQDKKEQKQKYSKQSIPFKLDGDSSKQFNGYYKNHLKLAHKQTALILTTNKREQTKSLILNKLLKRKLQQLKAQPFNTQSLEQSVDQQQLLQRLRLQDEQNKCLLLKYLSQKYKNLCKINQQILSEIRQTK